MPTAPPSWIPIASQRRVTEFGAVGDGNPANAARNNIAFQQALHYAGVSGGQVLVPPGFYPLNQSQVIPSNVQLVGEGAGSTLQWLTNAPFLKVGLDANSPNTWHDVAIANLHLDAVHQGGTLIQISGGGNRATIRDCLIENSTGWGIEASGNFPQSDPGASGVRIDNCEISFCLAGGIHLAIGQAYIDHCILQNGGTGQVGYGLLLESTREVRVANSDIIGFNRGLMMNSVRGSQVNVGIATSFVNVAFDTCRETGVVIGDPAISPVLNVQFSHCWIGSNGTGLWIPNAEGVVIEACSLEGNNANGAQFGMYAHAISFLGNLVAGNGMVPGAGGWGVSLNGDVDRILIQGNQIGETENRWRGTQIGPIVLGTSIPACGSIEILGNALIIESGGQFNQGIVGPRLPCGSGPVHRFFGNFGHAGLWTDEFY